MAKKHTEKFDPAEVPILLDKARAGDIVARDELVYRFQRLISTLVNVCLTGRPNYFSSYQKTFLQLFAGKKVPLTTIAMMLKKELILFEKDELFSTGQLAVYNAIEKCETNLASTIVICFKELIFKMIKDPKNMANWDDLKMEPVAPAFDAEIAMDLFLVTLTSEEFEIVLAIMDGGKVKNIPLELKQKVQAHFL
jgi:hypothetical protein